MKQKIAITGLQTLSALGSNTNEIWEAYLQPSHGITTNEAGDLMAPLQDEDRVLIAKLQQEDVKYKALDTTVLFALFCARKAMQQAGWQKGDDVGINVGSSRGATALFETYHKEFVKTGKATTLSSPSTTLGNIASWVAHDLQTTGPEISHSITCSTALHAVLNGVAWLQSGMVSKFMVGGSEAPLTPFTIAQMKALKVYATAAQSYPCQALNLDKKRNTMVLGEGAGMACLELGETKKALAYISGIGYATEVLTHSVSVSEDAECFQKSMKAAMVGIDRNEIDAFVMHAPGTIKGDSSEYLAIQKVFGENMPVLTTNKWKVGHTFGASGLLSLELAVLMLQQQQFVGVPFVEQVAPKRLQNILVNAVGFGGNAVSVLLTRA